jgi:hypothetical protein
MQSRAKVLTYAAILVVSVAACVAARLLRSSRAAVAFPIDS